MKYLLFYDYVEDIVERRTPLRAEHLRLAERYHERGALLLAGALTEPVDGAIFVFNDQESAEAFAREDPYFRNGLVTTHRIRGWNVVVGG